MNKTQKKVIKAHFEQGPGMETIINHVTLSTNEDKSIQVSHSGIPVRNGGYLVGELIRKGDTFMNLPYSLVFTVSTRGKVIKYNWTE